jgi:hypothetical protein
MIVNSAFTSEVHDGVEMISGSGTPYCPCVTMRLCRSLTVGNAMPGDLLDCVDTDTWQPYQGAIRSTSTATRECVRITTHDGAVLECSVETLFTLRDNSTMMAQGMLGLEALTDREGEHPLRWSRVVAVAAIGAKRVKMIDAGGATFAAGKGERRIYGHNAYKTGQTPNYG